jgi:glucose/arabinose dehydrogenase
MTTKTSTLLALTLIFTVVVSAAAQPATQQFPTIQLPAGYHIEKVVDTLTYPTSLTFDDDGRMYVAEAGGGFNEEPAPARILRVENGQATEVVDLSNPNVVASVVGLEYHDGSFFFTHRAADLTGAVSRATLDGTITPVLSGIIDSPSEHQVNSIELGPDGRMYVAAGPAGNAAVIGLDNGPNIEAAPDVRTTSCVDIVLTGQNFQTPDIRTPDDQSDLTLTGAYVPFGTSTTPGQRIEGTNKCGGAILAFDPADPAGTLRPYAHGFRNVIDLTFDPSGQMYASVNGYDVRGSRPVQDEYDPTYRVQEGAWYGWPDYSAALEPLTDPKFDVPDNLQVPVFVNGQIQMGPIQIDFVIDHAASGLQVADRSLVAGLHDFGSSPSGLDAAPNTWGALAGDLFVAEWGDLSPGTNPLRTTMPGSKVSHIDTATGKVTDFVTNLKPGPASEQGALGKGIERPFDVEFGPDGAMYIVDYGVARVNMARVAQGKLPYEFPPQTGAIWKVTPTNVVPETMPDTGIDDLVGNGLAGSIAVGSFLLAVGGYTLRRRSAWQS